MTRLTLVTRSGCSLCEAMQLELEVFTTGRKMTVELLDVDEDPRLLALYSDKVPVLLFEARPVCQYFFDSEALKAILGD